MSYIPWHRNNVASTAKYAIPPHQPTYNTPWKHGLPMSWHVPAFLGNPGADDGMMAVGWMKEDSRRVFLTSSHLRRGEGDVFSSPVFKSAAGFA